MLGLGKTKLAVLTSSQRGGGPGPPQHSYDVVMPISIVETIFRQFNQNC